MIVRGRKSMGMSTSRDQSPALPFPDYAPDPGIILADLSQKVSAMEVILERKADADKIRSLVAISDEAMLLQAKQIILAGEVHFVDLLQDWNGTSPGKVNAKLTTIRGGVVRTEQLVSTNWSAEDGSCIDLDDGTIIMGGSENPGLLYSKETGLVIDGAVKASSFILNGSSEPPTLGDLLDMAEGALTEDSLNERLADGVNSVLAGVNGDFRLNLGTSSLIVAHKDINLSGLGSGYSGDLRSGVAVTGTGIAMGFNRKSDGNWINAVSIGSTGNVSILGTLTAGSVIDASATVSGTAMSAIRDGAIYGEDIWDKLLVSGTTTLRGVIQPDTTGAIRTGTITWNSTTGALTGGTGIAITQWGIIGAASGVATFSVSASTGQATYAGNIITGGQVRATGSTNDTSFGNYSILANPSSSSVNGILGQSVNGIGIRGYSQNNFAGLFTGGGAQPTVYIESGSSAAGLRVQGNTSTSVAIDISQGYITRPYSTTGVIEVFNMSGVTQGIFRYEFRASA